MTDLPIGWAWVTVGEVCDINPRFFDDMPGDDELISKVPMAAVEAESGRLDPSELVEYGSVKGKSLTPFQENDVLFAKVTPCMENGKIALARDLHGGRAVGSTELFALRSRGAVVPSYLMYFLLQKSVRKEAERAMTGAVGLRRVPRNFLSSIPIPLPPLVEQRRIVVALANYLSRLERGARSLSKVAQVEKSGDIRKRKGLVVDFLQSIRDSWVWPADKDQLPSGWRWGSLGDVLEDIEAGRSFQCEARPAELDEWGVIKISAMTWGEFRGEENKALPSTGRPDEQYEIHTGDILVSRANTEEYVGAPVLVGPCRPRLLLSDKSLRLKPLPGVDREWLIHALASPKVRSEISAKATGIKDSMRNISQRSLRSIRIPIPPAQDQRIIAAEIAEGFAKADELERISADLLEQANLLRIGIMNSAFSGRLVPQNPVDRRHQRC